MIDLGISKLALIGAVALIVIGPEKLPRVARTVGTLLGKAQRYVADVKAEVNRSIALEELQKMRSTVESAAREVQQDLQSGVDDFEKTWAEATQLANPDGATAPDAGQPSVAGALAGPSYRPPRKNWRVKQAAVPHWYKARAGVRTKVLSGAARVARYRPRSNSQ
ncbi:MAG: Sec-independent protein translocase protein TatB [Rhodoferax sp.]